MTATLRQTAIASTVLALSLLLVANPEIAHARPTAPAGFTWYEATNGVGTFLRPDGWFIKEETKNGTKALFITREKMAQSKRFSVGLSVNKITGFSRRYNAPASTYAKAHIARIKRRYETITSGEVKGNKYTMFVARISGMNGNVRTIVHHIAVGMDDEDEVFLIWFEAPADEWNLLKGVGRPILNYFLLGS